MPTNNRNPKPDAVTAAPLSVASALIGAAGILAAAVIVFVVLRTHCEPATNGAVFVGGLDPCIKDSIDAVVSIAGLLAIAATAWGVINELRKQRNARIDQAAAVQSGNRIREEDLRWRQATFAYKLLDDLFDDEAGEFLKRLDRGNVPGAAGDDKLLFDRFVTIFGAPEGGRTPAGQDLVDVRLQFDRVLYYLDRIQHAIDVGILQFDDVKAALSWYARLLAPYTPRIAAYAHGIDYARAASLLEQLSKADGSQGQARR